MALLQKTIFDEKWIQKISENHWLKKSNMAVFYFLQQSPEIALRLMFS